MKILEWLKNLFRKEEVEVEPEYPPEFVIVDLNPEAKREGLKGNRNKIIYHYHYSWEHPREYLYSRAVLKGIVETRNIPFRDISEEDKEPEILEEVRPDLMEYEP